MRSRYVAGLAVVGLLLALVLPQGQASATYRAKNGLIAFTVETDAGTQVYTVRPNGKDLLQVTNAHRDATTPDWSPDGQWLAYSLGECQIALIRPDGTRRRIIPSQTPGGCETDPSFTPDGEHLVFELYDPSNNDDDAIWIMNLNGDERRRIARAPGGAATPEVSPDGQTLTFLSWTPSDLTALFAAPLSGGDAEQITPTLFGIAFKHDWAPDGSRLVMSDNADNFDEPANIATIRSDGTGLQYLTHLTKPDQRALVGGYSPNGKWIVYRLEHGDQNALMVMRTNGQGAHALLPFSSFRPRYIDWGPATR